MEVDDATHNSQHRTTQALTVVNRVQEVRDVAQGLIGRELKDELDLCALVQIRIFQDGFKSYGVGDPKQQRKWEIQSLKICRPQRNPVRSVKLLKFYSLNSQLFVTKFRSQTKPLYPATNRKHPSR